MTRVPITCEIIPRPNSSPEKLKALGAAIETWHDAWTSDFGRSGVHFCLNEADMRDLARGELPLPAHLRAGSLTPEHGTRRSVRLIGTASERYDREEVVRLLHRYIRDDLVADILIDGTSWSVGD